MKLRKTDVRKHDRTSKKGKIRVKKHERELSKTSMTKHARKNPRSNNVKKVSEFAGEDWDLVDEKEIRKFNDEHNENYEFYFVASSGETVDKLFGGYGIPFLHSDAYQVL